MHRAVLQFFVLTLALAALASAAKYQPRIATTPATQKTQVSLPTASTRTPNQPTAATEDVSLPAPEPELVPALGDLSNLPTSAEPNSALRLLDAVQAAEQNRAPMPAPAKPTTVTSADIRARIDHPSCGLPPYTKEIAKANLAAAGSLDPAEASRVWDTFDQFCGRDFSLFYELESADARARANPAATTTLPTENELANLTLSPEAFRHVEELVQRIWGEQGYNSNFLGEGIPAPNTDALGVTIPPATAPLGIQCGGRTVSPEGLGPTWWTCKCTGCCIPCRLGCCLPSCELGCRPRAYLWDSITGICGCGI
ncbi:hypothetical protein HY573_00595 [Candidatus Parcubacteria bacterium]|nr:hypothetical protein [Candidatus Parcubacteria bacterium]